MGTDGRPGPSIRQRSPLGDSGTEAAAFQYHVLECYASLSKLELIIGLRMVGLRFTVLRC